MFRMTCKQHLTRKSQQWVTRTCCCRRSSPKSSVKKVRRNRSTNEMITLRYTHLLCPLLILLLCDFQLLTICLLYKTSCHSSSSISRNASKKSVLRTRKQTERAPFASSPRIDFVYLPFITPRSHRSLTSDNARVVFIEKELYEEGEAIVFQFCRNDVGKLPSVFSIGNCVCR